MGLCRFWVYVIAGATGHGWTERLADLVRRGAGVLHRRLGLRRAAQKFSRAGSILAAVLLAAPIILAMVMNVGRRAQSRDMVVARCWRCGSPGACGQFFIGGETNVGESFPACSQELFSWTGWPSRRNAPCDERRCFLRCSARRNGCRDSCRRREPDFLRAKHSLLKLRLNRGEVKLY